MELNISVLIGLAVLYILWLAGMRKVHAYFGGSRREEWPMTLTFYTFGLAAPIVLARKYSGWALLEKLKKRASDLSLSGLFSRGGDEFQGDGEEIEIRLRRQDGSRPGSAGDTDGGMLPEVKRILQDAIRQRATDVHFEPGDTQLNVRYRIDGVLQHRRSYSAGIAPRMIGALKVLAGEDVAESRRAQDGSFRGNLDGRGIDFRTATTGTSTGEKMVVRILDRKTSLRSLERLGLRKETYRRIKNILHQTNGMLLASGPTGSGKTTTLYAALQEVDRAAKNVTTIEDPVEYNLDDITQLAINEEAGITFADQLRTVLRQDPDVMMVGEVRDRETAEIAMQAAQTGHLVLSTVHANDTISCIYRLFDLSVRPYLIATSVEAILSQRLVRRLCMECREERKPTSREREQLGLRESGDYTVYDAVGCEKCHGTGFHGRIGTFELMAFNDRIRDLIQEEAPISRLRQEALRSGMVPLRKDALAKALRGITTVQEAIRATG
ncbi:MAG: GspE/PulE family protein [Planctomycetota bacterium]